MGERGVGAPPFPSLLVSKHKPSVKKSSIWGRKKSPMLDMCFDVPRYYNLNNRQAGRPLNLPLPERPGISIASGGGTGPSGTLSNQKVLNPDYALRLSS
jgi:hypothetical protein